MDWEQLFTAVGGAIVTVGGMVTAIWLGVLKQRKSVAETRADVAESEAAQARAESSEAVFSMVTARLAQVEMELSKQRDELVVVYKLLREKDAKVHALELYVQDLQHVLHTHGIDVPPMRTVIST